jgi:MYXO-CTERM domain-containing protein
VGGAPLGGDAYFTSFSSTAMNSLGQIAFQALLNGNGIAGGPGGNNSGIFAYTPAGGICLVARTADLFEVAPGDFRQISSLGGIVSSGGSDGRVRSLNDNGLLVFQLDFTDGTSGIFTASIPSPSAAALLALGFLAASRRRRA